MIRLNLATGSTTSPDNLSFTFVNTHGLAFSREIQYVKGQPSAPIHLPFMSSFP